MHYQTILITLFATAAFAKDPWVSSYYNADCTDDGAGDAVSFSSENCVAFDSVYNSVMVNFGSGIDRITSVSVFSDANCLNPAGADVSSSLANDTVAQCINQRQWGDKWGSVRNIAPA